MFGQGTTFVIFLFTLSQDDAQSEPTMAPLRIPMDARKDESMNTRIELNRVITI